MLRTKILGYFAFLFFFVFISGCYPQTQAEESLKQKVIIPIKVSVTGANGQLQAAVPVGSDNHYFWDFGQVKTGEIVRHSFLIENNSDKALTITGINTSCACTNSELKDKIVNPWQNTRILVRFNSKDYTPSIVTQHVYVNTDNTDNPVLRFTIKAEIVK